MLRKNLISAKILFFTTAMSGVGWNRFQNNFYLDNGLSSHEIGALKSIGLLLKIVGKWNSNIAMLLHISHLLREVECYSNLILCFLILGEPLWSMVADLTDQKLVFGGCMIMQVLTMEILRISKPLTYNTIFLVKVLRTTTAPSNTLTTTASFKLTEGTNEGAFRATTIV